MWSYSGYACGDGGKTSGSPQKSADWVLEVLLLKQPTLAEHCEERSLPSSGITVSTVSEVKSYSTAVDQGGCFGPMGYAGESLTATIPPSNRLIAKMQRKALRLWRTRRSEGALQERKGMQMPCSSSSERSKDKLYCHSDLCDY